MKKENLKSVFLLSTTFFTIAQSINNYQNLIAGIKNYGKAHKNEEKTLDIEGDIRIGALFPIHKARDQKNHVVTRHHSFNHVVFQAER